MKQKIFRVTEELDNTLKALALKTGMSIQEIIQKGIVSMAVANDVDVDIDSIRNDRSYRRPFTPEDIAKLKEMIKEGRSNPEMAKAMGRNYQTVMTRVYRLKKAM